jgi:hypothetical protein
MQHYTPISRAILISCELEPTFSILVIKCRISCKWLIFCFLISKVILSPTPVLSTHFVSRRMLPICKSLPELLTSPVVMLSPRECYPCVRPYLSFIPSRHVVSTRIVRILVSRYLGRKHIHVVIFDSVIN